MCLFEAAVARQLAKVECYSQKNVPRHPQLAAMQVPHDFLAQPGSERVIVLEVLDSQPDHLHLAAQPLQVAIAVIDVTALVAMVRAVGLDDQGTAPAHDQDVRAPRVTRPQADTGQRRDRDRVVLRETGLQALERPVDAQLPVTAEHQPVLGGVRATGTLAAGLVTRAIESQAGAKRGPPAGVDLRQRGAGPDVDDILYAVALSDVAQRFRDPRGPPQ